MEFEQVDIKINDFILRIKDDGEWVRLDTGRMIEADDYHLDISSKLQIEALAILQGIFEDKIREYIELSEAGESNEAWRIFKEVKKTFVESEKAE